MIWRIERPFSNVDGFFCHVRRNIDEFDNRRRSDTWTFAGKRNVWGETMDLPRDQFTRLQELVGENTILFPTESAVRLDIAHAHAGLKLFSCGSTENQTLISELLKALN
jgi:hypothetical protein